MLEFGEPVSAADLLLEDEAEALVVESYNAQKVLQIFQIQHEYVCQ